MKIFDILLSLWLVDELGGLDINIRVKGFPFTWHSYLMKSPQILLWRPREKVHRWTCAVKAGQGPLKSENGWGVAISGSWLSIQSQSSFCQASVCSSVLCLITTKIWSDRHWSPLGGHSSWVLDRPVLQLLNKSVLQLSVTALFYLEDSRKIHLRGVRARRSKTGREECPSVQERESQEGFGSSFYMFLCPWACLM